MKIGNDAPLLSPSRLMARLGLKALAGAGVLSLVAYSAVVAKEARSAPLLAAVRAVQADSLEIVPAPAAHAVGMATADAGLVAVKESDVADSSLEGIVEQSEEPVEEVAVVETRKIDPLAADPNVRWFNGRPIRPVKVLTMTVTAYSPDSRSCGDSADGITATLHSVETNAFRLVAADPRVLAYGSMITVPGYDSDRVVPVLDCGGAIKGSRLDVLFPTHEAARKWGVRKVPVTVWGYVDGKPAENPRKQR